MLNVYDGNECVIHNGYSGNSSVWINYRGATGTGITEYVMGNGLSDGGNANVRANSFIGNLTGNVTGMLNVCWVDECVIHNGYSRNSAVWINYRGATGTGIT